MSGMPMISSWRLKTSTAPTSSGCTGQASCAIRAYSASRQDSLYRLPLQATQRRAPPGNEWHHVRLPRLHSCMGQLQARQECSAANHDQEPVCSCAGVGERLVQAPPASRHRRATSPLGERDAGTLCLLWYIGQQSSTAMVRLPGRADMAEVALPTRSTGSVPVGAPARAAEAYSSSFGPHRPPLHRHERNSSVRNRMRETCTSGSVRGEGGNLLTYSARKGWVSNG